MIFKVLKVNTKSEVILNVRNSKVEEVDSFTCLGANVTKDDGATTDIRKMVAKSSTSLFFKSLVISVLLYGCEIGKLKKIKKKKIDSFKTKCLRKIHKVRWQQHLSNLTLLKMKETSNISE